MQRLRSSAPGTIGGLAVRQVRDYVNLTTTDAGGRSQPLVAPPGDMVILDLAEEGHYIAIRPSGTEPKVKFYLFTCIAPDRMRYLDEARDVLQERLAQLETDLRQFSDDV
jgi:phosphoglucomutase/phosphomannomutase